MNLHIILKGTRYALSFSPNLWFSPSFMVVGADPLLIPFESSRFAALINIGYFNDQRLLIDELDQPPARNRRIGSGWFLHPITFTLAHSRYLPQSQGNQEKGSSPLKAVEGSRCTVSEDSPKVHYSTCCDRCGTQTATQERERRKNTF